MTIKIQCPCGTRYAFDIEPIKGRMPVRVNCPGCGADGTESANAVIAQQLAPAEEGAPRVRLSGAAPIAPVAAPAADPTSADGGEAMTLPVPEVEHCPKHRQQIVAEHCRVCGKPICATCMQQFGYVCSVYCQSQARQRNIPLPVFAGQKFVAQASEWRKVRLISLGLAAAAVLLLAVYLWFITVGSKPRTLYTLATSKADQPVVSHLVSPAELVVLRAGKLSLIDVERGKELWSASVNTSKSAAAPPKGSLLDFDFASPPPRVQVTADDVWISLADRVARFDRKTGKPKSEIPINGSLREIEFSPASILVVSEDPSRQKSVTRIELPSGAVRTDLVTALLPSKTTAARAGQRTAVPVRPPGVENDYAAFDAEGSTREFSAAGPNVVQVQSKLLEKKMVAVQAMKAAGPSTLNSGGLTARDSMKATMEELNNMQRETTGGVRYDDESRYQVTLRRFAPADAPDWTGEVVGPPLFFPLKSVDVLVSGKSIHVFSKKNQMLWEGKLTFPVADRFAFSGGENAAASPCVEEAGSLYVFDKGTLIAFDLRNGNARWRVPSVGISQVNQDRRGMLYVVSTSASPESIQYSQQVRIADKPYPVILKVDSSSGKVLWRSEKLGDACFVSDKYLYVTSAQVSGLDVIRAGGDDTDAPVHFRIYRLNPGNGDYLWQFYDQKAPQHVEVQKNRLLLQYPGEVRVLTYRTM